MGKVIGIDIGGTKINACLIDDKGEILERKEEILDAQSHLVGGATC